MRTRRSPRNQDRLWKAIGRDLQRAADAATAAEALRRLDAREAEYRANPGHTDEETGQWIPHEPEDA